MRIDTSSVVVTVLPSTLSTVGAATDLYTSQELAAGDTRKYLWSGNFRPIEALNRGAWNTIHVRVPADAGPLWSLGVELFASHPYTGTAYVDNVGY